MRLGLGETEADNGHEEVINRDRDHNDGKQEVERWEARFVGLRTPIEVLVPIGERNDLEQEHEGLCRIVEADQAVLHVPPTKVALHPIPTRG